MRLIPHVNNGSVNRTRLVERFDRIYLTELHHRPPRQTGAPFARCQWLQNRRRLGCNRILAGGSSDDGGFEGYILMAWVSEGSFFGGRGCVGYFPWDYSRFCLMGLLRGRVWVMSGRGGVPEMILAGREDWSTMQGRVWVMSGRGGVPEMILAGREDLPTMHGRVWVMSGRGGVPDMVLAGREDWRSMHGRVWVMSGRGGVPEMILAGREDWRSMHGRVWVMSGRGGVPEMILAGREDWSSDPPLPGTNNLIYNV
jgi:hypothetical protein